MIYHVFANRSNIGDWLSAKGIQELLKPYLVKECLCDTPFVPETINTLLKANEKDLIIIGGGGLLMDYFIPFWENFLPIAENVPFCIWGIGYCDLKYEETRPPLGLIEEIIKKSKLCVVRDEITTKYLENCKLGEPVACPSLFVVQRPDKYENKGLLHMDNYTTVGAENYEVMCTEGKLFAHNNGYNYYSTNNRISQGNKKELEKILNSYRNSEYILSSGLHGCIFGVAMGKKVLAVSGDRKIDAFMGSVGLKDWVLDLKEINQIPEKLNELHRQKDVNPFVEKCRQMNLNVAKQVVAIIKNNKIVIS